MTDILKITNVNEGHQSAWFWCPACQGHHPFTIKHPVASKAWSFDGNMTKPTFSPSLRVYGPKGNDTACHLFVRNGMIEYCGDCPHELAGKTIPMTPHRL